MARPAAQKPGQPGALTPRRPPRALPRLLPRAALAALLASAPAAALPARSRAAPPAPDPEARALVLADIHLDPFESPALARSLDAAPARRWEAILNRDARRAPSGPGADTDWALWRSALDALPRRRVAYVLLLGDYLCHGFGARYDRMVGGGAAARREFALKEIGVLKRSLEERLPGVPLYWVLGNEDSPDGDYAVRAGGIFLGRLAGLWLPPGDPTARRSFARWGCASRALPGRAGTLVSLDDVLWAQERRGPGDGSGAAEMAWLKRRLARREAGPLLLALHIPPGRDPYAAAHGRPAGFLRPRFERALEALLGAHPGRVRLVLAGHTHFDDFRLVRGPRGAVAAHLALSLSPVHGNAPGFSELDYRVADGTPLDWRTYTLDRGSPGRSNRWGLEYDFHRTYGTAFDPAGIAAAVSAIEAGGKARASYDRLYAGGAFTLSGPQERAQIRALEVHGPAPKSPALDPAPAH